MKISIPLNVPSKNKTFLTNFYLSYGFVSEKILIINNGSAYKLFEYMCVQYILIRVTKTSGVLCTSGRSKRAE